MGFKGLCGLEAPKAGLRSFNMTDDFNMGAANSGADYFNNCFFSRPCEAVAIT